MWLMEVGVMKLGIGGNPRDLSLHLNVVLFIWSSSMCTKVHLQEHYNELVARFWS